MAAQTRPRRRRTANPDTVLQQVVTLTAAETERLQAKAATQVACPHCGLDAGLDPTERQWLAQALRDLTKLALGARKQILESTLRGLSQGGLDAVEQAGRGAKWLP